MENIYLNTQSKKISADTITPVSAYLKLRDKQPHCILLESNENGDIQNSKSIIGLQPIISIHANGKKSTSICINGNESNSKKTDAIETMKTLMAAIKCQDKNLANAFYGYFSYDSIPLFEDITLRNDEIDIPLFNYSVYAYILVFNHFNDTVELCCNNLPDTEFNISQLENLLKSPGPSESFFECTSELNCDIDDDAFLKQINKGIQHCLIGDVIQIVLSRAFKTNFIGDDFEVYRRLRNINPSPYLFFFDFGDFKLFGSSPESLVKINHHTAAVNPIAGTYKKIGDFEEDLANITALKLDEKENAEHVMLVDLARNDLSKIGRNTNVTKYKEVHHYSHLIHLVSEVQTEIPESTHCLDVFGSVFPAGTLSGAPKYKAMQLIDELEPNNRSFYGGAIGIIGLDNTMNQAIMIRTILSKNYRLHLQAGAGIVAKSIPEKELEEVNTKLGALKMAIEQAAIKIKHKVIQ
jgi:anthranilate synthase component I